MKSNAFRLVASFFILLISALIAFIVIPNFVGAKANFNRLIVEPQPSAGDSCNIYFIEEDQSYLVYSNYLNDSLVQTVPESSGDLAFKIKWNGEWVKEYNFAKDYFETDHDFIFHLNIEHPEQSSLKIEGDELDLTIE